MDDRLKYLIDKFNIGKINYREHDELLDLLARPHNKEFANEFFAESWNRFSPNEVNLLEIEPSQQLEKIFNQNNKPKNRVLLNYIKYAAAASIIFFCFIFLYRSTTNPAKQQMVSSAILTDLEPGKNQATLTLTNNQKIILDDSKSGIISETSNLIIKKNNHDEIVIETKQGVALNGLNTISTPKGGQFTIILPDKSKVYLNSETTLTFPTEFKPDERKVSLDGEAYFEVAKNKTRPFFVETNEMTIQVLGTHFNVYAYQSEPLKSTVLVEGSIKISTATISKTVAPGEQADVKKGAEGIHLHPADIEQVLAWKNGYFLFIDKDLKTIMRSLSRWYNFDIKYGKSFKNEIFTGTISRSQNISEILKIFETTGTVKFKILSEGILDNERRVIIMN